MSKLDLRRRSNLGRAIVTASLLAVLATAAACGSTTPTPAPSATPSAVASASAGPTAGAAPSQTAGPTSNASADLATYAQIEAQVQAIRQLGAKSTVTPILLTEQGVKDWLTKAYQNDVDHVALAYQSRLFAHLGLLPAGTSLEKLELDLNSGQAIGFYDPKSKGLYVLSEGGQIGPVQKLTFSHEFTHALQDQNFGLDKLAIDTVDQGDQDLARTALAEGDASLAMTQWAETNMSLADLLAVSLDSATAEQQRQLDAAPAILREDLLFPYVEGLSFVQDVYAAGGWQAVDKLYANPPASTSQILHPDLYRGNVLPAKVSVPGVPSVLGKGWKLAFQDTMGELQLRVWLAGEHPTSAATTAATTAVASWGGDRVGLYEGPNGTWAVVLNTQWRGAAGAEAFRTEAAAKLNAAPTPATVCDSGASVSVVIASDTAALGAFATCKPGE